MHCPSVPRVAVPGVLVTGVLVTSVFVASVFVASRFVRGVRVSVVAGVRVMGGHGALACEVVVG
jgi:hypothetical protein